MGAALAQVRRLNMKTRFSYNGKETMVCVLRRYKDPEKLTVIEAHKLIATINAELAECGVRFRLIRPGVADFLLNKTPNWEEVEEGFPAPTDAGIGYERPGDRLGTEIVYAEKNQPKLILPTGKYKGEKDIALVVPNLTIGDFDIRSREIIMNVLDSRIVPVYHFPPKDGWHMPHAETTVPHGKEIGGYVYPKDARCLSRKEYSSYVGKLTRYISAAGGHGNYRQAVSARSMPSARGGVVAEFEVVDAAKLSVAHPQMLSTP